MEKSDLIKWREEAMAQIDMYPLTLFHGHPYLLGYLHACRKRQEKIDILKDLISEAAPMAWIAHHSMDAANEWEKKAFELIGGKVK